MEPSFAATAQEMNSSVVKGPRTLASTPSISARLLGANQRSFRPAPAQAS
jgi:hypothetical protein